MVADLVAPERQEAAYASVRVAANLGVTIGPPIGGLLLIGGHWNHLWLGTLVLSAIGFAIAFRYIPRGGAYAPEGPPRARLVRRDHPRLAVPALHALVGLRDDDLHRDRGAAADLGDDDASSRRRRVWGCLMILNPLFVTVFQLRLTRRVAHIPASLKLGIAMPMMGVPFLLLNVNGSAPVIGLVIIIFVIGEMLWVPTSQAVVAALAPGGHPRRVHGRLRRHLVGGLGADAVPRPAGAPRLRRRDDVDVRRRASA